MSRKILMMGLRGKTTLASALARRAPRLSLALQHRYRYIFILGHMRSGSTLLSHILASHPDIVGAGETHIRYSAPADLAILVLKICVLLHRPVLRETYVVDQINHDFVTDDMLRSDTISRCIILLREPEATLPSLMEHQDLTERGAIDYYVDRLEQLIRYATLLRERAALVEYDDLVDKTELTLSALTEFLGLLSPLSPNYALHRMTARVGDRSSNIKIGKVVRTPKRHINISRGIIATAADHYAKCRATILSAGARVMT